MAFFLLKRDGRPTAFPLLMLAGALPLACANAFGMAGDFMRNVSTADRWTAAAIVAAFFAVFALASLKRRPWPASAWILGLGGMTYPLYLLHNRMGKTLYDAFESRIGAIPLLLAISVAMLALAYSIHVLLERRIADRLKARLIAAGGLVRSLFRENSREHTS
jgi:peptidoglycan/LPS O-acetylase OafA/YrhL